MPDKPRKFTAKKGAQEAHEAIRPRHYQDPDTIKKYLKRDQYRLYKLIWDRFLASQMESATIEQVRVDIDAGDYLFRANGSALNFQDLWCFILKGRMRKRKGKQLPQLKEGQKLEPVTISPEQHFTQPPPRFTEASLVKTLENKGIGRPALILLLLILSEQRLCNKGE